MSKRKATTSGGLGDNFPQVLTIPLTQTGANAFTEVSIPISASRFASGRDKAVVMEILKVHFTWSNQLQSTAATTTAMLLSTGSLAALTTINAELRSPLLIAHMLEHDFAVVTPTSVVTRWPTVYDTSDGNGMGILIAVDNLFFTIDSVAQASAVVGIARITYRYIEASLKEYIGIVQSQTVASN